jgi:CheY-like chemotaxis protein
LAILMDVNMPVMDGIDATLALRADPQFREIPIFALTGDVSVLNQRRIGEAGVNGYLEKPITWEILRQALAPLKGV